MKILGIDPGLNHTGWGIIEKLSYDDIRYIDCGVINSVVSNSLEDKLKFIYAEIVRVIKLYSPIIVAMEEVFINTNPQSSKKLIMARTAAFLACCNNNLHVSEYAPTTVKKNITGNGRASKLQVYTMIQKILRISIDKDNKNRTYDSIDAIAVAMCQAFINKIF